MTSESRLEMGEELDNEWRREIEAQIGALFVLVEATLVSQMTSVPPNERARVKEALLEVAARTGGRPMALLEVSIGRVFQSFS
jgi:protein subunit release factor A